jgi:hypothetical protein
MLALLFLVIVSAPCRANPAITSSCTATVSSGSPSCVITPGANQIILVTSYNYSASQLPTDTLSASYSQIVEGSHLFFPQVSFVDIYCGLSGSGGSDTVTVPGTAPATHDVGMTAASYSGTLLSCTADAIGNQGAGTTGGAATISTANFTSTQPDLFVSVFFDYPNAGATAGSGWTIRLTVLEAGTGSHLLSYQDNQSSPVAGTYAGTLHDPGSNSWIGIAAAFKLPATNTFRNHSSIIKRRIPWDNRRRKLGIVRI